MPMHPYVKAIHDIAASALAGELSDRELADMRTRIDSRLNALKQPALRSEYQAAPGEDFEHYFMRFSMWVKTALGIFEAKRADVDRLPQFLLEDGTLLSDFLI